MDRSGPFTMDWNGWACIDIDQVLTDWTAPWSKEDGSECGIFSFDVQKNKSCLPLARNAVRKLRTLRHPGVIKVFDTVEVLYSVYLDSVKALIEGADWVIYLCGRRACSPSSMACPQEKSERRDTQMGLVYDCSMRLEAYSMVQILNEIFTELSSIY